MVVRTGSNQLAPAWLSVTENITQFLTYLNILHEHRSLSQLPPQFGHHTERTERLYYALSELALRSCKLLAEIENASRKVSESLEGGSQMIWRADDGIVEATKHMQRLKLFQRTASDAEAVAGESATVISAYAAEKLFKSPAEDSCVPRTVSITGAIPSIDWIYRAEPFNFGR
jgi:hypothetical protein